MAGQTQLQWVFLRKATLAQSVEQLIRNQQVVGSNPTGGSKKIKGFFPAQLLKIVRGAYLVPLTRGNRAGEVGVDGRCPVSHLFSHLLRCKRSGLWVLSP